MMLHGNRHILCIVPIGALSSFFPQLDLISLQRPLSSSYVVKIVKHCVNGKSFAAKGRQKIQVCGIKWSTVCCSLLDDVFK